MKKIQKMLVLTLLCFLLLSLTACDLKIDDSAVREETAAMLDALLADDYETCRSLMDSQIDDDAVASGYAQMRQILDGVESYELTAISWNKNVTNGVSKTTIGYQLEANGNTYHVEVSETSDSEGLTGFYVTKYESATVTGTLWSMSGANGIQWAFLILGFAEVAFIIWMLVDCCRHKFPNKAIWIVIVLLANVAVSLVLTDGNLRLSYNIGFLWTHTALLCYSTGGFTARLFLPVGALIYAIQRKKLHTPPAYPPMYTPPKE